MSLSLDDYGHVFPRWIPTKKLGTTNDGITQCFDGLWHVPHSSSCANRDTHYTTTGVLYDGYGRGAMAPLP